MRHPEAARPPPALGVEVGPGGDQSVDHLPAPGAVQRRRVERADRVVDPLQQGRMTREQPSDERDVIGLDRLHQLDGLVPLLLRQRIDVGLQLRPAGKPILAGDDELGVAEGQLGLGSDRIRGMVLADALERLRVAGGVGLEEVLGLILELVEVRRAGSCRGIDERSFT